ncbi:MAG TPA: peptidase E [Vicinamibacterales bacterium]|jgi:peptidase E|nr:peptidase E [Vicinamibacterales bacterium]
MPTRQIIAMGGASFVSSIKNPALERYILAQSPHRNPAVCFIPTATGDSPKYIRNFYRAFGRLECRPTHLSFFQRTPDLRALILSQDVIYVGGGNTKSMLAVWRDWGLPDILKEAWHAGIVLGGVSAGAICWFETGVTDSWAGHLAPLDCLGFLRGTCCPHYDGETDRRPSVHRFVQDGTMEDVLALDDGVAAHYVGARLARLVSSRPRAHGYRIVRRRDRVVETALPTSLISKRGKIGKKRKKRSNVARHAETK